MYPVCTQVRWADTEINQRWFTILMDEPMRDLSGEAFVRYLTPS